VVANRAEAPVQLARDLILAVGRVTVVSRSPYAEVWTDFSGAGRSWPSRFR
jgi:hypothetical protein